jgi:AraC family transcriptional regulator
MDAMEWLNKMMDAINYMEGHMDEQINIEDVAKVACSSTFHFQRMFHMLTSFTVAEYIRNRRLTLAAQELAISSNIRVIDVALKYGYDSPESFAKAFRRAHGITPSAAREQGVNLKAFPRISFHLSLKGDKDMDYRLVQKDAFKVIGKIITVSTINGENHRMITEFWKECNSNGTSERICSAGSNDTMLGICMDFEHDNEQFAYMIAVEDKNNSNADDLQTRVIPAATWAIFTSVGPMPNAIIDVWSRIFQEWFPATGYQHADGPELEVYLPGDTSSKDYKCEVWIPIVKK